MDSKIDLPAELAARVAEAVGRQLVMPYGLRSLALSDPRYRGRYGGDPASHDSAYHQETVWPWLMGPCVTAYRKVHGSSADWIEPFRRFIQEEGAADPGSVRRRCAAPAERLNGPGVQYGGTVTVPARGASGGAPNDPQASPEPPSILCV